MYIDLLDNPSGEGSLPIRLQSGSMEGVPIVRTDGVTLYAPFEQINSFKDLILNYYGDLSGGGFLISSPQGTESCA